MTTSFNRNVFGKFKKDLSIVSIFHGTNGLLLEDELNELQWIKFEHNASILRDQYTNGFLKKFVIKADSSDNTFYVETNDAKPFSLIVDGYQLSIGSNNFGHLLSREDRLVFELPPVSEIARKDLIFLEVWFEILSYSDDFHKFGGEDTEILPLMILDDRMNEETSRRIQLRWRLRVVEDGNFENGITAHRYNNTNSGIKYQQNGDIYTASIGNQTGTDGQLKALRYVYAVPLFEVNRPSNSNTIKLEDIIEIYPKVLYNDNTTVSSLNKEIEKYTDSKIAELVDSAPETLDTLNELANALGNDPNFATTITNKLGNKVDKVTGKQLSTEDYTTWEKKKLAGIEENATNYIHPSTHPASMIEEDENHRFSTDSEKESWNNKLDSTNELSVDTLKGEVTVSKLIVKDSISSINNTAQVVFKSGEMRKTIAHNIDTDRYMVTLGSNSVARHVAYENKIANSVDIVLDSPYAGGSITVDVIFLEY